jgi:hypothetical protein
MIYMMAINHLAVFAAAVSDFVVGALWFSPLLFYKSWLKENSLTEEILKKGGPAVTYGLTFMLALIISYNLAFFLAEAGTTTMWGLTAGFLAGIWAAAGFAIISIFEKKTVKYILIDCGYLLVAFALKGLILGAWRLAMAKVSLTIFSVLIALINCNETDRFDLCLSMSACFCIQTVRQGMAI